MKINWLKNQLVGAKQASPLWASFTNIIEELWNEQIEPILTRISNRKSFFTMDSEDMDTRIAEYGRFFVIGEKDKSKRPMLLTQRLDEIRFKGTYQPIEQTFWREFRRMPVSWQPLYAPVDLDATPYCSFLATAEEVQWAVEKYGEFFLTSRGRVVLNLNQLYTEYDVVEWDKAVENILDDFKTIIAPLVPLHIVFDGVAFRLTASIKETVYHLVQGVSDVEVHGGLLLSETQERLTDAVTTTVSTKVAMERVVRSTEDIRICFDTMPLDAWHLDVTNISRSA